jgi:hypothetical protein
MKKLRKPKAGKVPQLCRQISEPAPRAKQEFVNQLRETEEDMTRRVRARHLMMTSPLDEILLSLGYEASLVQMLGRRYRC